MATRVQVHDVAQPGFGVHVGAAIPKPGAAIREPVVAASENGAAARDQPLSEAASFLLDIIRFGAAVLVVVAHIGHAEITTGFRDRQVLGQVAVPVFFVLSGFVIRFITRARRGSMRGFFIDRAARMYSVALPAMALTLLLTGLTRKVAPVYYARYFAAFADHPLLRVAANLTFLSQSWGHTVIPFLDLPFWSLSYECLYYAAYGLAFYLRGWQRVAALCVWTVVAVPQVLFLLPVWWLGCWVFDLYRALRLTRTARAIRLGTILYLAAGVVLLAAGSRPALTWPARALGAFAALPHPLAALHVAPERATLMALGTGAAAGVALLLLLLLSDLVRLAWLGRWARRFRYFADGTFSLYLLHYPLMVAATALGLYRPRTPALSLATTLAICATLIALARPMDTLKVRIRSALQRMLPAAPSRQSRERSDFEPASAGP